MVSQKALLETARALSVDRVTVEVAGAFAEAKVGTLLLKGPVLSALLYRDGSVRSYGDSDFLVSPDDAPKARAALADLGFRLFPTTLPVARPPKATEWVRETDGAVVDLHTTLPLLGVTEADAWRELSSDADTIRIAGTDIPTLSRGGIALHVALHAVGHGVRVQKPLEDLRRACSSWDLAVWRAAAALASRLHADEAFAAGLRLVAEGAEIARALALTKRLTPEIALLMESAPRYSFEGISWLAQQDSLRKKISIVLLALMPPADVLRTRYAVARKGPIGLAASVLVNLGALLRGTPRAYGAWRRAKRAAR